MFVPGLGAFAVFRIAKEIAPFTNPLVVLALSGVMSFFLALWAYRMARRESFSAIFKTDGWKRIGWIGGWVGCVYGVQLSLLVLAILRVFVGYDFLAHPDGPAMMALIIPTMDFYMPATTEMYFEEVCSTINFDMLNPDSIVGIFAPN